MNIQTVADNLKRTIAGKEHMLAGLKDGGDAGMYTLRHMLNLNIDELKRILQDVEVCMNTQAANSWVGQVDRQSGAFDESELRGRDGWS